MNLAALAQRNSRGVLAAVLFLAALGAVAFTRMPASILPAFPFPRLVVIVQAGDLAIQDMLLRVTRPLESAANGVPGAKRVFTKTSRGAMEMSIDFDWGADLDQAFTRLNANVSSLRASFPAEAEVQVERMDPSSFPVIGYSLTSDRLSPRELLDVANLEIVPPLSRLEGVYKILIQGGYRREYQVLLDAEALARLKITPAEVSRSLADTNLLQATGRFSRRGQGYLVLVTGEFRKPDDILDVAVAQRDGRVVRVREVGRVVEGQEARQEVVTADGREAVLLSILQQPGASTAAVSGEISRALKELQGSLPPGVRLKCFYNEADLLHDSLESLRDSILIGALLAVGVLLLFLRSWRSVLVVLLCLPLTVLIAFLALKALNQTLNLMTLGGLAVGLGLIIDDVVVTLENIYRHAESGKPPGQAARDAAAEIFKPMVGSTLTTVAVFLPLAFLSEITGAFFAPLSITLIILLLVSVGLAITLVPVVTGRLLRGVRPHKETDSGPAERFAGGLLDVSLRFPWAPLGFAAVMALAAALLFPTLPSGFMPEMDEGALVLDYLGAPGAPLEDTDRQARIVEQEIMATPEVDSYSRRLGLEMGFFTTEPNRGDIMIKLKPRRERKRSMRQVMEDLEARCSARLPGMTFEAIAPIADRVGDIAGEPSPIEVKLYGEDPAVLERLGKQAEEIVSSVRGTTESVHELAVAGPELEVRIDPARAAAVGVTPRQVAEALRSGMEGAEDTLVRSGERLIGVRVLYPMSERRTIPQIARLPILTASGRRIPLEAVADIREVPGVYEAMRENQMPFVPVTASLSHRDLGSANAEVRRLIHDKLRLPSGYTVQYGGLYFTQQRSFESLLTVLLLGAALVFVVTLFQYNRFAEPLALMITSALALGSVVLTLRVTNTPFNASSFTGGIMIFGMVMTNGIVLMDTLRAEAARCDAAEQAIRAAALRRVRPVMMTSSIAILALLPLSLGIGAGAEMQQPLAIAVIGGLVTAPLYTLVLTPVLVRLFRGGKLAASPEG